MPAGFRSESAIWVTGQHSSNPLAGAETLKGNTAAFIVEGYKALNKIVEIQEGKTEWAKRHPFRDQLKYAAVLAFLNGANAAKDADWEPLNESGVKDVYFIPDTDAPGRKAIPAVSKAVRKPMITVEFDATFGTAFDLADDIPNVHFNKVGDYVGPSFFSFYRPATYLADLVAVGDRGKHIAVLRPHVIEEWAYLKSAKLFVHKTLPYEYTYEEMNANLAPFSPVKDIARLILKETPLGYVDSFAFLPAKAPIGSGLSPANRLLAVDGKTKVNRYVPPSYSKAKGDISVFLAYLDHLVPDQTERRHLIEWAGTLIAKPSVRLKYGVLITSEQSGTGKSVFGERILRPLVGAEYVSMPTEADIMSEFNDWAFCKRLAIFEEVYSSTSKAVYNKLKNPLTANTISYRTLYRAPIVIDNCCTIYAPSNDKRPLRLDQTDRRWLCVSAAETKWGEENWRKLIAFLDDGGMAQVAYFFHHLEEYGFSYVHNGAEAPLTDAKEELLAESLSENLFAIKMFCETVSAAKEPFATTVEMLKAWAEAKTKQSCYDRPKAIKQFCCKHGLAGFDDSKLRVTYERAPQTPVFNQAMADLISGKNWSEQQPILKSKMLRPWQLLEDEDGEHQYETGDYRKELGALA